MGENSYVPARDIKEAVTSEFINAEVAGIRTEFADLRTEMRKLADRSLVTLVVVLLTAVGVAISLVR